jgi:hypothetical protein
MATAAVTFTYLECDNGGLQLEALCKSSEQITNDLSLVCCRSDFAEHNEATISILFLEDQCHWHAARVFTRFTQLKLAIQHFFMLTMTQACTT